jgi:hypothetical protein
VDEKIALRQAERHRRIFCRTEVYVLRGLRN